MITKARHDCGSGYLGHIIERDGLRFCALCGTEIEKNYNYSPKIEIEGIIIKADFNSIVI